MRVSVCLCEQIDKFQILKERVLGHCHAYMTLYEGVFHSWGPKSLRLRSMPTEATKAALLPKRTPVTKPVWSAGRENVTAIQWLLFSGAPLRIWLQQ